MEKNIGGGYVYTESDSSASYADKGFSVEALNDVEVSNPENGQALVYDASSEKWVNDSIGGDFDAIVHCSQPSDSGASPVTIIERGTFAALYQMLEHERMPSFLITYWNSSEYKCLSTAAVCIYAYESGYIRVIGRVPTEASASYWPIIDVTWYSDDTISWEAR